MEKVIYNLSVGLQSKNYIKYLLLDNISCFKVIVVKVSFNLEFNTYAIVYGELIAVYTQRTERRETTFDLGKKTKLDVVKRQQNK